MAQTFPTTLNTHKKDWDNTTEVADVHPEEHNDIAEAVEALEAKVGADSSAVTTSHDYKLSEVTGSDKAVSKTATQTLTNKTLTSPVINTGDINDPDIDGGSHNDGTFDNPTLTGGVEIDLGSDATGDVYYRDASGNFVRLPIGTSGQRLTVAAGVPVWQTPTGTSVIVHAYIASNQTVSTNSATKVTFDSEEIDTGADFASGTFTVPEDGYYNINSRLIASFSGTSDTTHSAKIYVNGVAVISSDSYTDAAGLKIQLNASAIKYLEVGDTVEIYYQSSQTTTNTIYGGATQSVLDITKL